MILALPLTCFIWSFASERHLGSAVDDATALAIHGGGCQNEISGFFCKKNGNCAASAIVFYTGNGDFQQDTTVMCGTMTSCISFSKTSKKCGG